MPKRANAGLHVVRACTGPTRMLTRSREHLVRSCDWLHKVDSAGRIVGLGCARNPLVSYAAWTIR